MERMNQDIKNATFQQFYLLMGDEGYLKKQYKAKLSQAIVNTDDAMNYLYMEGNHPDLQAIYEAGETMPFFSDYRLIVLENTGLLKKAAEGVSEHFEQFPDSTIVIMVEDEVDGRNSLYKWFQKHGYVAKLDMPDEKKLIAWIRKLCAEEGMTIEDTAVFYMIEHMGTEMFLLKNELEKLFSYCATKNTITIEDIRQVCIDEADDKMFDMLDAIGGKNQKKALKLYHDLLELRRPAMQILSLLTRHYNILLQVESLYKASIDSKTIASLCGIPPFTVKKYVNQSLAFDNHQLKQMLERCIETDQEIKTGLIKDTVGVELLIVSFSGR